MPARVTIMHDELPVFTIGSAAAPADTLATFEMAVQDVFSIRPVDRGAAPVVAARAWHLGTIMFGCFAGPPLHFDRSPALIAGSGLDHVLVQLYHEGGFTGVAGHRPITVSAGDICVFDLADTLSTRSTAFANYSLMLPRALLREAIGDIGALQGLVLPAASPITGVFADHMHSLAQRLPHCTGVEATLAARATASLATLILSSEAGRPLAPASARPVLSRLARVNAFLDRHIGDPGLDADRIAAGAGLSRASLYRLFEDAGGIGRHLRRRRLSGAALELADPTRRVRIGEVAERWGFGTDRGFARTFRQAFGMSPSAARERSIAHLASGGPRTGDPDAAAFARWMRGLHGRA